ncbi:Hypothetical protein A7982_11310 [Minicystis rosea]|nr:Hypothetical protein A7982_11310 [Minicystis rosea]
MSERHAARLDRAALPAYVTVTDLGRGIRLQVPEDQPRGDLESLVAALGALVPSTPEATRWTTERAAERPPAAPAPDAQH